MFVFELMDNLIDPFNPDYCLSFFVSKQKFISEVEILFSGYYSYFKSSFIVDIHELLINKQNNIKSLFIYPSSNRTYSNLRLIIGKYYYLTINNFHKVDLVLDNSSLSFPSISVTFTFHSFML